VTETNNENGDVMVFFSSFPFSFCPFLFTHSFFGHL